MNKELRIQEMSDVITNWGSAFKNAGTSVCINVATNNDITVAVTGAQTVSAKSTEFLDLNDFIGWLRKHALGIGE